MTAAAVAIAAALYQVRDAILLVYSSVMLAIGFGPVVRSVERQQLVPVGTKRLPRWLAILVVYVAIIGVLVIVAIMVIPPLVTQAEQVWHQLPSILDRVQSYLMEHGILSEPITLEQAVQQGPSGRSAVATAATALSFVGQGLFGLITVVILTFYLLVESDALFAGFARLFPRDDRARVVNVSHRVSAKVSAWLIGQLILAGTIGGSSAIALYLIGVPYFYVLALISAVGEMIPVVGPVLSAIPAVAAAFTVSPKVALITAIFFIVQQQTENHLLVPRIMARQVGVSPVIVIVSLLVGGSLLGILGAVLAVPTAATIQVIVGEILEERDKSDAASPAGSG